MAWCSNTGLQAILGFLLEKIQLLWLFHSALIKLGWSFVVSFRRSWTPSVEASPCFYKLQDDPIRIFSSTGFICVFKYQYKSMHTQMYFFEGFKNLLLLLLFPAGDTYVVWIWFSQMTKKTACLKWQALHPEVSWLSFPNYVPELFNFLYCV